jgi:hypothetical protein
MVDAVWELDVEDFGPLSVEVDHKGRASYARLREVVLRDNLAQVYSDLGVDGDSDFVWWPRVSPGTRDAWRYATSVSDESEDKLQS